MTPQEIRRAYRAKSLKLHPDKNPGGEVEAAADFSEVANAYEVLSDAATRRDYDYVLAHPEEFFSNHYKYYRYKYRRMDGRAVCLVLVLLLSALQYANMWLTHRRFKRCAANLPTFKLREAQLKRQRLSEIEAEVRSQGGGKRAKRKAKMLLQSELQAGEGPSLEVELEGRGWGQMPRLTDLLFWKLLVLPCFVVWRVYDLSRWAFLYWILKREYTFEDASRRTMWALRITQERWDQIALPGGGLGGGRYHQEELVKRRLWVSSGSPAPPPPPVTTFGGLRQLRPFLTRPGDLPPPSCRRFPLTG